MFPLIETRKGGGAVVPKIVVIRKLVTEISSVESIASRSVYNYELNTSRT